MNREWNNFLANNNLLKKIEELINKAYKTKETIYPSKEDCLRLFNLISPKEVKVVIIGQDPYHNPKQANGIAFSASNEIKTPKSLINIFKELDSDLNIKHYDNNDLSGWVEQGVLLINTCWTVIENNPGSHAKLGWQEIVSVILSNLNKNNPNLVYCLWGNYAKRVYENLEFKTSNVISSAHPSPFSYLKGFKESKPFSKINAILLNNDLEPIDWSK
ncbi:uracil-DNA glycosylase [Mesoplasma entomophilum]|uniref:Uracil-DNA glycosylase n=1 Tax=Mesoplasma entomophilum TaxID=2149 RepID=A0A3S5XZH7_9MOLU|nr:uracil-DNA glycosylase [Mesoplasma entomophilum]ATQ35402.1 uracil-DNA glycosylase [Mesoplasma entomophilum]ATZ19359.1 uracil-DNA glycosylase [Mesoplasma entomophilum]